MNSTPPLLPLVTGVSVCSTTVGIKLCCMFLATWLPSDMGPLEAGLATCSGTDGALVFGAIGACGTRTAGAGDVWAALRVRITRLGFDHACIVVGVLGFVMTAEV